MISQAKIDKFWSHVDKTGECWLWTGVVNSAGYGITRIVPGQRAAHRASYVIEHGEIPAGAFVCHTCDVPRCVRGQHLYAGDAFTNATDRKERGRTGGTPGGPPRGPIYVGHPRQLSAAALASAALWRAARAEIGGSQAHLGFALGCSPVTIGKAEVGMSIPAPQLLTKLHALLEQSRALRVALPAGERAHPPSM